MTERDALYAAVLASPADDLPRLVFADWCDDHGEPDRAEFIRVQVELARLPADDPRRGPLEDREDELLDAGHDRWKVPDIRGVQGFVRGFVELWDGTAEWLLAAADRLFDQAPIRVVRVRNADRYAGRLTRLRGLARVEELDLSGNTLAAGGKLQRLLTDTPLDRLRTLRVGNNRLFADALPQIADSPVARRLTALDLSGNPLSDDGMEALAAATAFAGLRELIVRNNEQSYEDSVTAVGGQVLTESTAYHHLRVLDLSGHHIGGDDDAALIAILRAPLVQQLDVLRLAQNDIGDLDDDPGSWLAGKEPDAAPRLLDLSGPRNAVGPQTAKALAGWAALARGTTVDLRRCRMTARAYAALAASPHRASLLIDPHLPEEV